MIKKIPLALKRILGIGLPASAEAKIEAIISAQRRSGASVFVETGTYLGDTLAAVKDRFDKSVSIEIDRGLHERAKGRFAGDKRVSLRLGDSGDILPAVIKDLRGPIVFWLDGHYSGGITGRGRSDTPIVSELDAILSHPDPHFILIDDARCFNGRDGYPKLSELRKRLKGTPYSMKVGGDIIRIRPREDSMNGLPDEQIRKECLNRLRDEAGKTLIGASANRTWQENRSELVRDMMSKDPAAFIDWPVIRLTMFHDCDKRELKELERGPDWDRIRPALRESRVGNPPPYRAFPSSSGNLIHHAYNFLRLRQEFGADPSEFNSIAEFGGGYGSACRLAYALGFRGKYAIFDLPEFLALQKYFLSMLGIVKEHRVCFAATADDVGRFADPDLCLATWSLSEAPLEARGKFLERLGSPGYFLIAYQDRFENVDNKAYFAGFRADRPGYCWVEREIPHLAGNRYLLGRKK